MDEGKVHVLALRECKTDTASVLLVDDAITDGEIDMAVVGRWVFQAMLELATTFMTSEHEEGDRPCLHLKPAMMDIEDIEELRFSQTAEDELEDLIQDVERGATD
jgi:hypothetical protein